MTGYFHCVSTGYRSGGVVTSKLLICVSYLVLITSLEIISDMLEALQGWIKPCGGIRWGEMLESIMIGDMQIIRQAGRVGGDLICIRGWKQTSTRVINNKMGESWRAWIVPKYTMSDTYQNFWSRPHG